MSTIVYGGGFLDIAGRSFGTIRVIALIGRNPVRWQVFCEKCRSTWNEEHTRLMNGAAICKNVRCLKEQQAERMRPAQSV